MSDEDRVVSWLREHGISPSVVALNAARLATGATTYGPLALAGDRRDFLREAGEEAVDALAYLAMHAIRGDGPPPSPDLLRALDALACCAT